MNKNYVLTNNSSGDCYVFSPCSEGVQVGRYNANNNPIRSERFEIAKARRIYAALMKRGYRAA